MMPITTGQAAASFVKYLAEPAARSLALGCLAAIALAAFRVKRVPLRLLVWTMMLYAALAMPFLGALLPRMMVHVPAQTTWLVQSVKHSFAQSFRRSEVRTVQAEGAGTSALANRVTSATPAARDDMEAMRADVKPSHIAPVRRQESATLATIPKSFTRPVRDTSTQAARGAVIPVIQTSQVPKGLSISWIAVGLAIYFAVTVLFFARLLVGMFFSWRLERASEEIHEREAIRLVRMRACMGGLESTPRLAEMKMLSVPATLGVLHPVILLPADWREWDEAKLDAIVAHEVSHVARRDALTQRLSLIHRAIFWFSPLAWWIDRQITELAEVASDEAALAGGADQARYAETLLGFFAELEAAPGRIHWEGISMANGCRAERRVERILSWKRTHSMKKWLAVMIVAVAAPLVFVAGSAHPLLAQQDNAPKKAGNKFKPGGPVAPALPAAPEGGVVAPALPAAPTEPGPGAGEFTPGPTPQVSSATPVAANAPMIAPPSNGFSTIAPQPEGVPTLTTEQASKIDRDISITPETVIRFENSASGPIRITRATLKIVLVGNELLITPPVLSLTNNTGKRIIRLRVDLRARQIFEDSVGFEVAIGPHNSYLLRPEWREWSNTVKSVRPEELAAKIIGVRFDDGGGWGNNDDLLLTPKPQTEGLLADELPLPDPGDAQYAPAKFINPNGAPVTINQARTRTDKPAPNTNERTFFGQGVTSYLPIVTLINNSDERVVGIKLRFKADTDSHTVKAIRVSIEPHGLYTFAQNSIMAGRPENMHVQVLGVEFEDGRVWGSMYSWIDSRQLWVKVPSQIGIAPVAATAPIAASTPYATFASVPVAPAALAGSFVRVRSTAPVSLMSSMAPTAPQAMIVAGDSVSGQEAEAQLRVALKDLQNADAQDDSSSAQIRAAQEALMKAQQASAEADSAQIRAAQQALEKARRMMDENDASQMRAANAALAEAKRDLEAAEQAQQGSYSYGYGYSNGGSRYVIMTGKDESVDMSGDDEDFQHAHRLREKLGKDLIWFERDEKSYVITDPAFIAKAKAPFAPEEELGKQQEELGRQQEALQKQQEALGDRMEDVKVKIHDITPQLEEVRARLKELKATGATQRELGQLQSELGQLQGEVGRFQSQAGVGQREIGQQQGELGRKQGELGRRQGELGRKQGELARQASRELRGMFDDAIAKGIAKPE